MTRDAKSPDGAGVNLGEQSVVHGGLKKSAARRVRVGIDDEGMRLDRFVGRALAGVPAAAVQRLLRTGQVRVNGGRARGHRRLKKGEEVRLPPVRPPEPSDENLPPPEGMVETVSERVLWRDPHLLVLDKPIGMPVHGGSGHRWGAIDAVREMVAREPGGGRPELCHRLDKETSGCLLFGLDGRSVRRVAEMLRHGGIEKRYRTLVRGEVRPANGEIDLALVKGMVRSGERMTTVEEGGQHALTRYRTVRRLGETSLLDVHLLTGRTHQIRVHFQQIGHPLAGDGKYGQRPFNRRMKKLGLKRMFLHAAQLKLKHPVTGTIIEVHAPLDERLERVLKRLESLEKE
ncbi:MAG: RluA family pseudouridine synthase [Magnetococcales bacterium]|nr:RluA family pseudouridine synthase [Magnetococcales bacterium]